MWSTFAFIMFTLCVLIIDKGRFIWFWEPVLINPKIVPKGLPSIRSWSVEGLVWLEVRSLGVHGIHSTRCQPASRAELHAANRAEGDRPDGWHRAAQVHRDRTTAEAEHLRGGHDTTVSLPRRKVSWSVWSDSNAMVLLFEWHSSVTPRRYLYQS